MNNGPVETPEPVVLPALDSALRRTVTANAAGHAQALAPVIADLQAQGRTSLRTLAEERNARGM